MGTHKSKQGGFTLVEIAIVLVIIGLLLGGILKGQELIQSARVRSLADAATGIQAAYFGFIDRYRQIPGDWGGAQALAAIGNNYPPGPPPPGGDGSGALTQTGLPGDAAESSAAWTQLSFAGFIQQGQYLGGAGAYTAAVFNPPGGPILAPQNSFSGLMILSRSAGYQQNVGVPAPRLGLFIGRNVPVNVLQELDVKMDDGSTPNSAGSGTLRAAVAGADLITGTPACTNAAPNISWAIAGASPDCNAFFIF